MRTDRFDLEEFLKQLRRVRTMGQLARLVARLPGVGGVKEALGVSEMDDRYFRQVEGVICAMTPQERRHPEIIDGYRRERIARGSGATAWEVYQLIMRFREPRQRA